LYDFSLGACLETLKREIRTAFDDTDEPRVDSLKILLDLIPALC